MQGAAPPPSDKPGGKAGRPERRVKITRLRARVAERLKGAQNTYAMLTTFNEIDMTNIMQLRKDFKASCGPASFPGRNLMSRPSSSTAPIAQLKILMKSITMSS